MLPESDKALKRVEIFGKVTINTEGSGGTCGKWKGKSWKVGVEVFRPERKRPI